MTFHYAPIFPATKDETPYRKLTGNGVRIEKFGARDLLVVEPEALRLLAEAAMIDINHLLRPGHLAQLAKILDDPEATANDKFVAYDLSEERQYRRRRHPADVPGHRHRDRHGQEGPARLHRGRRRSRARRRHPGCL